MSAAENSDESATAQTDGNESGASTQIRMVEVEGQSLRVGIRAGNGNGTPLLIFNGIGANLELLESLTQALDGFETVVFDVPGVGGSPSPRLPYRLWNLSRLAERMMTRLGYAGAFDVLGLSWGGALAQQFAFQFPNRCRRLILAATTPGSIAIPGRPSVLSKMVSPRRFTDPNFMAKSAATLYGGSLRRRPELMRAHLSQVRAPGSRGYFYQLLAGWGWSSLFWLPMLRQPTLILAGSDDPIIPLANAKLMAKLIPNSTLHVVDDGHLFIITEARSIAPVIQKFLQENSSSKTCHYIEKKMSNDAA